MFEPTPAPAPAPAPAAAPAATPDTGKAVAKALEAERKKVEQAAEKKAQAERLAEATRQALADKARHNAALGFGQRPAASAQRAWSAVGLDEPPAAAPADAPGGATRPAAPRSFFSHLTPDPDD